MPAATGATGITGLQGPPGVASFAYFSNIGAQCVEPGGAVRFNQVPLPAVLPTDIGFISPSQIVVNTAGIYEIVFYALPENNNVTLAVYIDGVEAPLSRYTTFTSAGMVYGQVLLNVALVPAVITIVNTDPAAVARLADGSLGNTINASVMISKLS